MIVASFTKPVKSDRKQNPTQNQEALRRIKQDPNHILYDVFDSGVSIRANKA